MANYAQEWAFLGNGTAYAGVAGFAKLPIGNMEKFDLSIKELVKKQKNMADGLGGTAASVTTIDEVTGSMTLLDISPINLARAMYGSNAAVPAGTVTSEAVVVYKGGLSKLAYVDPTVSSVNIATYATGIATFTGVGTADDTFTAGGVAYTLKAAYASTANLIVIGATDTITRNNIVAAINAGTGSGTVYGSSTVINPQVTALADTIAGDPVIRLTAKVSGTAGNAYTLAEASTAIAVTGSGTLAGGSGTSTVYTAGSDYVVEGNGLWIPEDSTIADGATVYATYTYPAQYRIEVATAVQQEMVLYFNGLDMNKGGAPVSVEVGRMKASPAASVSFLADDFAKMEITFECLADRTKGAGISQFVTIQKATA